MSAPYDPFAPGPFAVRERAFEARDAVRGRNFPCATWQPAGAGDGPFPLVLFSHPSGSHRRSATFLCGHLASHGYVVAALDHSETIAPELRRPDGEDAAGRAARVEAIIASRVPDLRFLLDRVLGDAVPGARVDATRVGAAGHSFGGWAALAAAQSDPRIVSVVALAPGGASNPRPGILPLVLRFDRRPPVPTLYVVAEDDTSLPLAGMREIFDRTPAPKRMAILARADHCHFMDDTEAIHEATRAMDWPRELAWMREMKPIAELCGGEAAHRFIRGAALCHLDATLRSDARAESWLAGTLAAEAGRQGVQATLRGA